MEHKAGIGDSQAATLRAKKGITGAASVVGQWGVSCIGANGVEKWRDNFKNLVTNQGLDHLLDVTLSAATATTTWYVGLASGTPTFSAADTMAGSTTSPLGWTEVTAYDEAARQTWTDAGVSSQSVTNSASVATFTCSTNSTTVGGAFLTSNSTKGGTTGVLYAGGAFSGGNKALDDGDTLEVTATFTTAAV